MARRTHVLVLAAALLPANVARAEIRGGALVGDRLLSWGDQLREYDLPSGSSRTLVDRTHHGSGGCATDVNRDGNTDLVLLDLSSREAVWLEAPEWKRHRIDTGADFSHCLGVTLFGRRGVLLVHRHAQVRFYERPEGDGVRWPYREIYSIYTPSAQGGLLMADLDGDGRQDILCGNYWIQSPAHFDLPWRLFAINNWWDGERSAMLRLALEPRGERFPVLVAAQQEASPASVSRFERPGDPKQFWAERRLQAPGGIHHVGALLVGEAEGNDAPDIYVGENRGPASRLVIFRREGVRGERVEVVPRTEGVIGLWLWRGRVLVLGPGGVALLPPQPRR